MPRLVLALVLLVILALIAVATAQVTYRVDVLYWPAQNKLETVRHRLIGMAREARHPATMQWVSDCIDCEAVCWCTSSSSPTWGTVYPTGAGRMRFAVLQGLSAHLVVGAVSDDRARSIARELASGQNEKIEHWYKRMCIDGALPGMSGKD